jgi:antitoxin MazE
MRVAKWGNSLAVRLPKPVIDALALKEGDEIEITVKRDGGFEVSHDRTIADAVEAMRALRRPLPPGFSFDRGEANER